MLLTGAVSCCSASRTTVEAELADQAAGRSLDTVWEIINEVLELKLLPVGKGTRTFGPQRVWRRWKLADDAQAPELTEAAAEPVAAVVKAAKAQADARG